MESALRVLTGPRLARPVPRLLGGRNMLPPTGKEVSAAAATNVSYAAKLPSRSVGGHWGATVLVSL